MDHVVSCVRFFVPADFPRRDEWRIVVLRRPKVNYIICLIFAQPLDCLHEDPGAGRA
jgi:hypothetical protein